MTRLACSILFITACGANVRAAAILVASQGRPELLLIDPAQPGPPVRIDLPAPASRFLLSPSGDFAYVVHDPCSALGRYRGSPALFVVDIKAATIRKALDLSCNIVGMDLTPDGHRLIVLGGGRPGVKKPKPWEAALVHIVDTEALTSTPISMGPHIDRYARSMGHSRIYGLSPVKRGALLKIADTATGDVNELSLSGTIAEIVLSSDNQWLYLIDAGRPDSNPKRHVDAKVHVIDPERTEVVATHSVGVFPRGVLSDARSGELIVLSHAGYRDHQGKLYRFRGPQVLDPVDQGRDALALQRLDGLPAPVLFRHNDACLLPEDGTPGPCVAFGGFRPTKVSGFETFGLHAAHLLEATPIPGQNGLLLRSGSNGDQISFVDWTRPTTSDPLTIGRPGSRAATKSKKIGGDVLLAAVVIMGCGMGGCALPQSRLPTDFWTSAPPVMRPDGRYAYVANMYSNDLAVIDTSAQKPVAYFALGGRARQILGSAGGDLICAFSKHQLTVIETAGHTLLTQRDIAGGIRQAVFVPATSP